MRKLNTNEKKLLKEIDENIKFFESYGSGASWKWYSLRARLMDSKSNEMLPITDKKIRKWYANSRKYGWTRGIHTLPKAIIILGTDLPAKRDLWIKYSNDAEKRAVGFGKSMSGNGWWIEDNTEELAPKLKFLPQWWDRKDMFAK